jgi:hypothetical protein
MLRKLSQAALQRPMSGKAQGVKGLNGKEYVLVLVRSGANASSK